ncbi:xylulose 5-phosphate 3-epimerase [Pseudomonas sp. LMG 31766]|jgi:phosphoketolase|uniref:Xylulose 5-phosphate 3-epimerase n=1 Tax=Pseudomonas chaetocerotis TaxID=2758695 RepID=A0A931GBK3_9PSED|nr:xylulose 5-phosphate 3-epimerase [Pseudomonas chaetocerotis]MBZ9665303.1 xylulose 5-phosphate 3-epimerase [Pseudomonas chaetocerotis]
MTQLLPDAATLAQHAQQYPDFARWQAGHGPVQHSSQTRAAVFRLAHQLVQNGMQPDLPSVYRLLRALDSLTAAGLWLVVHMTYAQRVRLDGQPLQADDFKPVPEGHTGGALNMVPAYAGYLTLNALTGETRGWLMGQGHCVAAIEALNLLTGNQHPEQAARYACDEMGMSRMVADFYSYAQAADGSPGVPLGSHVNPHTAGGIAEGGYLGFAELQYAHLPLPGEKLVAFLSDGAAEEQRGSDWMPRWWRAEDCGVALPVMIANGRRIEQRTELGTLEGLEGFRRHLRGCGFDPVTFDGRDPAAFVCALWEMEQRLARRVNELSNELIGYPLPMPYGIAETTKGYGFFGAGSNAAHNLPLPASPAQDEHARELFNQHAAALWVEPQALSEACSLFALRAGRVRERDNPLARRQPALPVQPQLHFHDRPCSPMSALDRYFVDLVRANPQLRPRVGNPDELASNRLSGVLAALKHRVSQPESEQESLHGAVITALNEEAVVSACLANQGGLNLVASYEAFCVKMLGAVRQSLIFARQQKEAGRPAGWLGWPLVATSHTWENGKNQQSHQDTAFCEALLGEMHDVMRVLFPADHNSLLALLPGIYQERGRLACLVVAKREQPCSFTVEQAQQLAREGALLVDAEGDGEPVLLIASGSYQLHEMRRAAVRLSEQGVAWRLIYLQEPGRFRMPRDAWEASSVASAAQREALFPIACRRRVLLGHMRPEAALGHLSTVLGDAATCRALGYRNRGGTFDEAGMLFANGCTWAHVLQSVGEVLGVSIDAWLTVEERAALAGRGNPLSLR